MPQGISNPVVIKAKVQSKRRQSYFPNSSWQQVTFSLSITSLIFYALKIITASGCFEVKLPLYELLCFIVNITLSLQLVFQLLQ